VAPAVFEVPVTAAKPAARGRVGAVGEPGAPARGRILFRATPRRCGWRWAGAFSGTVGNSNRYAFPAGLVIASLLTCAGCERRANEGTSIDMTVSERDGAAALEFGNWVLVFEGIPAAKVPVGTKGYMHYPTPAVVSFSGQRQLGDLHVKQSVDSMKNAVAVNDCKFTIVEH
jgi:hypothetical protein